MKRLAGNKEEEGRDLELAFGHLDKVGFHLHGEESVKGKAEGGKQMESEGEVRIKKGEGIAQNFKAF
jgi:hypothetical protein